MRLFLLFGCLWGKTLTKNNCWYGQTCCGQLSLWASVFPSQTVFLSSVLWPPRLVSFLHDWCVGSVDWLFLYSAVLWFRTLLCVAIYSVTDQWLSHYAAQFWISTEVAYSQLEPCKIVSFLVHFLCSPYNHAPVHSFVQNHVLMVPVCLAEPATYPFGRMDGIFFSATAVTQGGTDPEMSQYKSLTLKKKILLPLLPGLEPAISQSWVQC